MHTDIVLFKTCEGNSLRIFLQLQHDPRTHLKDIRTVGKLIPNKVPVSLAKVGLDSIGSHLLIDLKHIVLFWQLWIIFF